MGSIGSQASILIVSASPDDRSVLFKALDVLEFDAIYTAHDYAQARSLLHQDLSIDLAILDCRADESVVIDFCRELQDLSQEGRVPIIGIRAGETDFTPWYAKSPPEDIVDWISSPVDSSDALARIDTLLSGRMVDDGSAISSVESQYQFVFEDSFDELLVVDPDSGRIIDINSTFVERSGFARVQVMGGMIESFDGLKAGAPRDDFLVELVSSGRATQRGRRVRADGTSYAVDVHARVSSSEGRRLHLYTFRKQDELGLYEQALSILARMSQSSGGELGLNHVVRNVVDWLELDFVMLSVMLGEGGDGTQTLLAHCQPPAESGGADPRREALMLRINDGEEFIHSSGASSLLGTDSFLKERGYECIIGLPMRDTRGAIVGGWLLARRERLELGAPVVDTLRIITHRLALDLEARRAREEWRVRGLQDALTGLPNRLLFNDRLESAIKEALRTGESFAVMFFDLDRFKKINDSLGHAMGDQVLLGVSRRLRASVRAPDTVARYAGDEFTLILRHITNREDVLKIADKIVRSMEAPLTLPDKLELHITATLGVSFFPDDASSAEELVKCADEAMYAAKAMGRNTFQAYVAKTDDSHQQKYALEEQLRLAQRNNELRVYYQPQIDTASEDIVGMEALVRWEHPELGLISPGFFIPLAEETGLIIQIGEWVLRTACVDTKRWNDHFQLPLRISVNLSALQLKQTNLVQIVESALAESGLEAHLLDLEVTESVSIKSIPNLQETLGDLRLLGCKVSIDDFGTGQSSLDYIKRFPADHIKIDQSFIRNIGVDPDDEAIVQATISMAHNLNRKVVAEGVETEHHLDFLREQGCDTLQGYLFCRPLAPVAFKSMLEGRDLLIRASMLE
ncbi:MAG: EAL domain-containing protein [Dokdonella sp.]